MGSLSRVFRRRRKSAVTIGLEAAKQLPVFIIKGNPFVDPDMDILDRLGAWAGLKVGDPIPVENNAWGPPLTALHKDAIAEIKKLRGGCGT